MGVEERDGGGALPFGTQAICIVGSMVPNTRSVERDFCACQRSLFTVFNRMTTRRSSSGIKSKADWYRNCPVKGARQNARQAYRR